MRAEPIGIGSALPPGIVGNAELAQRLGVSEEWIVARTGIKTRRRARQDDTLVALAAQAGSSALADAHIEGAELDLVVVATITPDQITPNAAPLVAARLGARAMSFDVGAACSGFVLALESAKAFIESGRARTALVIGADLLSRITNHDDRSTAALFADGAGAVVLRAREGSEGDKAFIAGSDGESAELVQAPLGGTIAMRGPDTFRVAVERLRASTMEVVAQARIGLEDIDLFVFHQANGRILQAVSERLQLSEERVVNVIGQTGNTSSASIPLALAQARADGRLENGSLLLLAAFGAGLTWAATLLRWGESDGR